MQPLYLDRDPAVTASLYTKHTAIDLLPKVAYMLCAAHYVLDREQMYYKVPIPQDTNSEFCVWARATSGNYMWLYGLFMAMLYEYANTNGKKHELKKYTEYLRKPPVGTVGSSWSSPPDGSPNEVGSNHPDYYRQLESPGEGLLQ